LKRSAEYLQLDGLVALRKGANANLGASWHVVGTGDFNGDSRSDILWQNESGQVTDWLGQPNGTSSTTISRSIRAPAGTCRSHSRTILGRGPDASERLIIEPSNKFE